MRKLTTLVMIALLSLSASLMAGGVRVRSLAGISSMVDSYNLAVFPQRTVNHGNCLWLANTNVLGGGEAGNSSSANILGGVRYQLSDYKMALQIVGKRKNGNTESTSLPTIANLLGESKGEEAGFLNAADNVFKLKWGMELSDKMLVGANISYNYSGNDYEYNSSSSSSSYSSKDDVVKNHSIWYFAARPGVTMNLDNKTFIDASLNIGFGSWSGEYTTKTSDTYNGVTTSENSDHYAKGTAEADGWFTMGADARYYKKEFMNPKIDLAPYMSFNYTNFGTTTPDTLVGTYDSSSDNLDKSLSKTNFILGSGIHFSPTATTKIYNELEFALSYTSQTNEHKENSSAGTSSSSYSEEVIKDNSRMTLFPTYRFGFETFHKFEDTNWIKEWLFVDCVKLRGGFEKKFESICEDIEVDGKSSSNNSGSTSSYSGSGETTDSYTESDFKITGGLQFNVGKWMIEMRGENNDFMKGVNMTNNNDTDDGFLKYINAAEF